MNSDYIILLYQGLKKQLKKYKDPKRISEIEERISWIVRTSLLLSQICLITLTTKGSELISKLLYGLR